jgi:hypothetical protein
MTSLDREFIRGNGRFAFDGFPIVEPRPVFVLVDELQPERC